MEVIKQIKMDLQNKQNVPVIDAVQGDGNTRVLEFSLYSGGVAWNVPDVVSVAVAYMRPDGAKGIYDTLADGSSAVSVSGNSVSAVIVPQAVSVDGDTKLTVVLTNDAGEQLATFGVVLRVEYNPAIGAVAPEDYINLRQVLVEMIEKVMVETGALPDFSVWVVDNGDGSGSSDVPVDDIRNAYDTGRVIHCKLEMQDQYYVELPLVKMRGDIFYFAAICDGVEWLVKITADEAGETAVTVTQRTVGAGSGGAGEDGGYYTPAVVDNGDGTMTVSFEPTKEEMDAVDPQTIALPSGPQGPQGEQGPKGADGAPGQDGYTPVRGVDYYTDADKAEWETFITTELAKRNQTQLIFVNSVEEMTDTTKLYVYAGEIWAYTTIQKEVEGGPTYTNLLPTAKAADRTTIYGGDYNGDGVADGYKEKTRLSSSGSESTNSAYEMNASGFIFPVKEGDILRIKGFSGGTQSCYVVAYDSSNAKTGHLDIVRTPSATIENNGYTYDADAELHYIPLTSAKFGTGFDAIRICYGDMAGDIITINQEIKENSTTIVTETKWASTGHAFAPADYENRIIDLEQKSLNHAGRIIALEKSVESGGADETEAAALERIKVWDKPVYDSAPVTLIADGAEKPALTDSDRTIDAIYAKYRALMAAYPDYITETNMGKSSESDTFTAVDMLRYDFKERDGLASSAYNPADVHETKPKIILMSGVHTEWVGVWGLYYALEEITTNPDFDDIRRNAHIIVIPCSNPYCLTSQTAIDGWRMSHVNANGVAIHNNFGVDHSTSGSVGEYNYGGSAPYSEPETQYIDAVMAENPDAVAFVSCHNNDYSTIFGAPVIWASSATYHMCNLTFRLVDKLTKAWLDKYGHTLKDSIDQYKINMDTNDYRLGRATMSTSKGTEQKNATKYGIMGVNLEISRMMKVFSGNTDGSSEVMTHGAEVYANFMRTLLATYDHKDKKEYAPNLPWSE